MSNGLDPDHSAGPDLGPNCLQRLSADDKSHPLQRKCEELNIYYNEEFKWLT